MWLTVYSLLKLEQMEILEKVEILQELRFLARIVFLSWLKEVEEDQRMIFRAAQATVEAGAGV